MALRDFDEAPLRRLVLPGLGWLRFAAWRARARDWIADYGIKTRGENAPIASLSGGNVQRAVLARELAGEGNVLIAVNPVFGLDFAAVRRDPRPHRPGARARRAPCCWSARTSTSCSSSPTASP